MKPVLDFLDEHCSGGELSLLGGHYAWPGRPDKFAIDSIRHVDEIGSSLTSPSGVKQTVFLDDIAAAVACSGGQCDVSGGPPRLASIPVDEFGPWIEQSLPALERHALARDDGWIAHARSLREIAVSHCARHGSDSHPLLHRLTVAGEYGPHGASRWLEAVEMLVYTTNKPAFRPLLLEAETGLALPAVLFERTITNAASRTLHKLKKSPHGRGLRTTVDDRGTTSFWVRGGDGGPIELRREEDGGARAANKCAGILAQLFFNLLRPAGRSVRNGTAAVFYLVPCYDRSRLRDGMQAFFELYRETDHWFGVSDVKLAAGFYSRPDRSEMLCDIYWFDRRRDVVRSATERVAMRAHRGSGSWVRTGTTEPSARRVYVDHNATTPLDPEVLDAMMPFLSDTFGNASSSHSFGWEAEYAIAEARGSVARLIGADPDEIFFTSGATESNNWILRHWAEAERKRIVSTAIEHKSVGAVLESLAEGGADIRLVPVSREGKPDLDAVAQALEPLSLLSLMTVNNEVHTLIDLEAIGTLCRRHEAVFHTDAAQAVGRTPIDVHRAGVHSMSLSAHKIYGPKGIGALYLDRSMHPRLKPLIRGGGQERSLRSGTLATSLIVGFGAACLVAVRRMEEEAARMRALADAFLRRLGERGVEFALVGPTALSERRPGALCVSVPGLDATRLCETMPDVALSQASACNSRGVGSHVLRELGFSIADARSVVRLAFGRTNLDEDALYVADRLAEASRLETRSAWVA